MVVQVFLDDDLRDGKQERQLGSRCERYPFIEGSVRCRAICAHPTHGSALRLRFVKHGGFARSGAAGRSLPHEQQHLGVGGIGVERTASGCQLERASDVRSSL